jgi:hypothetical protein
MAAAATGQWEGMMAGELMVTLLLVLDRGRAIEFGDDPSVVLDPGEVTAMTKA